VSKRAIFTLLSLHGEFYICIVVYSDKTWQTVFYFSEGGAGRWPPSPSAGAHGTTQYAYMRISSSSTEQSLYLQLILLASVKAGRWPFDKTLLWDMQQFLQSFNHLVDTGAHLNCSFRLQFVRLQTPIQLVIAILHLADSLLYNNKNNIINYLLIN